MQYPLLIILGYFALLLVCSVVEGGVECEFIGPHDAEKKFILTNQSLGNGSSGFVFLGLEVTIPLAVAIKRGFRAGGDNNNLTGEKEFYTTIKPILVAAAANQDFSTAAGIPMPYDCFGNFGKTIPAIGSDTSPSSSSGQPVSIIYDQNIVVELMDTTVESISACGNIFSPQEKKILISHMLRPLLVMHTHGFVHYDVSLKNYMFKRRDILKNDIDLFAIDFGYTKFRRGMEHNAEYDPRHDLVGLAKIWIFLLTGFTEDTILQVKVNENGESSDTRIAKKAKTDAEMNVVPVHDFYDDQGISNIAHFWIKKMLQLCSESTDIKGIADIEAFLKLICVLGYKDETDVKDQNGTLLSMFGVDMAKPLPTQIADYVN